MRLAILFHRLTHFLITNMSAARTSSTAKSEIKCRTNLLQFHLSRIWSYRVNVQQTAIASASHTAMHISIFVTAQRLRITVYDKKRNWKQFNILKKVRFFPFNAPFSFYFISFSSLSSHDLMRFRWTTTMRTCHCRSVCSFLNFLSFAWHTSSQLEIRNRKNAAKKLYFKMRWQRAYKREMRMSRQAYSLKALFGRFRICIEPNFYGAHSASEWVNVYIIYLIRHVLLIFFFSFIHSAPFVLLSHVPRLLLVSNQLYVF